MPAPFSSPDMTLHSAEPLALAKDERGDAIPVFTVFSWSVSFPFLVVRGRPLLDQSASIFKISIDSLYSVFHAILLCITFHVQMRRIETYKESRNSQPLFSLRRASLVRFAWGL